MKTLIRARTKVTDSRCGALFCVLVGVHWLGCVDFRSVVCKWSSVVCSFRKTLLNRCVMWSLALQIRNDLNVDMI